MAANTLLVTLLPTIVTFLVTSGVWVGVFFAVGLNQPSSTSNYYYGDTSQPALPPPIPTYPPAESCPAAGTYSKCSVDCEFQICESVPDDLYDTDRGTWSTTKCWLRLIESAEHEIVMGTYYWTLLEAETDKDCKDKEKCAKWSDEGKQVYDALVAAAQRGIAIRISVNTPDPNGNGFAKEHTLIEPMAIRDVNPEKVQVRSVNFTRIIGGGGILHTKESEPAKRCLKKKNNDFFSLSPWTASTGTPGRPTLTGARSLRATKEIGVATFNCACVAEDLQRILESHWYMGAEDAVLPASWPAEYTTNAGHDRPYNVPRTEGPATAIHFSTAPPQFNACGRDNDIDNMIQMIDEAEDYLYMAVMDYAPTSLFEGKTTPNIYYERLDAAIKRAAYERFVDPGVTPCKTGSIDARLYNLPEEGWEGVPFVRYQHTKFFISERAAFIGLFSRVRNSGTSNWAADYWINTAGISIAIRSADHGGQEQLVDLVKKVYLEDWNSPYATPISKFSLNGTRIED
ncbi:hypothetical protein PRIPAC_78144 [Pristionchus pacificus]|uniref:PLDc_3 domain-containing protein n=1 Tax=Pristionchus pacificus TaxID=54126 RepID=A0A2A6CNP6_PRIPA|nr:hypothetical protein PRIPAC_78144 [Pristionchus pacificus]|eukprot:PDM79845.1 hypothetical protein PRIPAC_32424 [Pristionchus pacificus]